MRCGLVLRDGGRISWDIFVVKLLEVRILRLFDYLFHMKVGEETISTVVIVALLFSHYSAAAALSAPENVNDDRLNRLNFS